MSTIEALGGGVGIGAILTALYGFLSLIPRLKQTERATEKVRGELAVSSDESIGQVIDRIDERSLTSLKALEDMRRESVSTRAEILTRLAHHDETLAEHSKELAEIREAWKLLS
ncbi:hypothetical protein [Trueperella pyogenes]|nr:hypothetical protein [Trueperella pyogenes]MCI7688952.1 hypothetical protein [Trueperella pyogenes]